MLIIFRAVVVLVAVSFLSACSSGGDTPPPPAPAVSVTLTVATAGTGVGLVTSNPAGLNCGTTCTLTVTSGTIVTLTASPAAGNTLASWGGACVTAAATCDVTVSANQTVTATFNPSTANPALTVTPSGTGGGAITCNGGACNPTYPWGTSVTLAAVPNGNSSFAGWSGGGCAGTAPCTVLLWDNTAITATFNTLPVTAQLSVTRLGTGAGTVTSNPAGITCGATCASNFPGGTVVTLTASAAVGSTFAGWSGGGCTGTGTCDVTLNANAAVTATFTTIPPTVTLTTTAAGTGTGTITCNGGVCQSSYPSGTALTIVATPAATSLFAGWGGACAASGTTTTCNVTINTNSTVSAMFNLPTLSIVVAGTGTVTSSPAGINCGSTCTASFSKNTTVTLTATGANFSGWSGGGCSGTGSCQIALAQNTTVTATFGVASSADRYLFFGNFSGPTGVTGSLMAVDPAAAGSTPITVSASVSNSVPLYSGSWDSVGKTFGNVLLEQQVYASGGRLWRVQGAKASGAPGSAANPAVQISGESNATHVCTLAIVDDASSPAARKMFYELPGADGQCGLVSGLGGTKADNVTKYVSAGAAVGTAPVSLPVGHSLLLDRSNIYDLNTGIATHIFVIDAANNNTLKLFNLTTQSLTSIQVNIPDANVVVQDTSDRVLLSSSGTNTLYVYTISTNQLVPLLTAGILSVSETLSDGANLFVSDSSAGIVYRVPLSASASGQVVPILNGGWAFAVSTNRVYAVNNNATSVLSVAKTGGAVRVDEPIVAGQNIAPSLGSANGLVYYTKYVSTFTPPPGAITSATTVALAENGVQVLTLANTTWAGSWFGPTFSPRGSFLVSKVFVTSIAGGQLNGGTMSVVDAATGTLGQTLGTVPATTPGIVPSPGAVFVTDVLGSSALAFGVLQDPTGFSSAVFFVDPAVPNSLVQVPVSPGPWLSAF